MRLSRWYSKPVRRGRSRCIGGPAPGLEQLEDRTVFNVSMTTRIDTLTSTWNITSSPIAAEDAIGPDGGASAHTYVSPALGSATLSPTTQRPPIWVAVARLGSAPNNQLTWQGPEPNDPLPVIPAVSAFESTPPPAISILLMSGRTPAPSTSAPLHLEVPAPISFAGSGSQTKAPEVVEDKGFEAVFAGPAARLDVSAGWMTTVSEDTAAWSRPLSLADTRVEEAAFALVSFSPPSAPALQPDQSMTSLPAPSDHDDGPRRVADVGEEDESQGREAGGDRPEPPADLENPWSVSGLKWAAGSGLFLVLYRKASGAWRAARHRSKRLTLCEIRNECELK
jgi:hypothetical protein